MITLLENLGLFLAGLGLSFWLGRVCMDGEIRKLKLDADHQKIRADSFLRQLNGLQADLLRAMERAKKAEDSLMAQKPSLSTVVAKALKTNKGVSKRNVTCNTL